jgi:hypothetical protein
VRTSSTLLRFPRRRAASRWAQQRPRRRVHCPSAHASNLAERASTCLPGAPPGLAPRAPGSGRHRAPRDGLLSSELPCEEIGGGPSSWDRSPPVGEEHRRARKRMRPGRGLRLRAATGRSGRNRSESSGAEQGRSHSPCAAHSTLQDRPRLWLDALRDPSGRERSPHSDAETRREHSREPLPGPRSKAARGDRWSPLEQLVPDAPE